MSRTSVDTFNALLKLYITYMDRIRTEPLTWEHAKPEEVITLEWSYPDTGAKVAVTQIVHFQV